MDPLGHLQDELYNAGIPIFNRHGTYLTREEREEMARKQGLCERCGIKTQRGKLRKTPLTDGDVYKGICIKCFPSKVPVKILAEYETRHPSRTAAVTVAAGPAGGGGGHVRHHTSLAAAARVVQTTNRATHMGGHRQTQSHIPSQSALLSSSSHHPPPAGNTRVHFPSTSSAARGGRGVVRSEVGSSLTGNGDANPQKSPMRRNMTMEERSERDPKQPMTRSQTDVAMSDPALDLDDLGSASQNDQDLDVSHSSISMHLVQQRSTHRSGPPEDYTGGGAIASMDGEESALKGLRINRDNPQMLRKFMHRLRNEGGGYDDFMGACMGEVFDLMDIYRADTRLLAVACGSLWRLSLEKEQKLQAAETGVVEAVIEALAWEQNRSDFDFVEWALGCLTNLSHVADNKGFIAEKGGIEHVIDIMESLADVTSVFMWACRCLYSLISEFEDENEEDSALLKNVIEKNIVAIHESHGIRAILKALSHPSNARDSSAQLWAIKLLWRLQDIPESSGGGTRSLKKLIEFGFVPVGVKILKSRSTTEELFQLTLDLLRWLLISAAAGIPNDPSFKDASDCIPSVSRMMFDFPEDVSMLVSCSRMIATLVGGSTEARLLVQESNGAEAIIQAVARYPENEALTESGAWAMWTMSSGDIFYKSSQLLPRSNAAFKVAGMKHSESKTVLYPLCGYYGNICTIRTLDSVDGIPVALIAQALKVLKDNKDMAREAERALSNIFSKFPQSIESIVSNGAFNVEETIAQIVAAPTSVDHYIIGILNAIASKSEDIRKVMLSGGAIPSLTKVLETNFAELIVSSSSSPSATTTRICFCMAVMEFMILLVGDSKTSISVPENIIQIVMGFLNVEEILNESAVSTSRSMRETVCILIRNLLLASSSKVDLSGIVDYITGNVIDTPNSTAEIKMEGIAVLWAFAGKYSSQCADSAILEKMFISILNAISQHKGATPNSPYHVGLQSMASGALCTITYSARNNSFPLESKHIDELVSLPYTALDCDPNSLEVFEKLIEIILNLSYLDELALVQGGVIVVIIDTMAEFEQNPTIQEIGCSVLAILASTENLQVNLSIVQTDGIDMIINALALFPGNVGVEMQACKALSHLSIDQESRILISSLGGIMLLGNAMKANMDNIGLLEGCCTAILNLSSDADDALLLGCSIINITIDVMRRHPDSATLQENGMGILQNISMRSLEAKKAIADAGGITAVTLAIQEHMATPSVLERAFTTLWSLAVLDVNQAVIADANGIGFVVNGMMCAITSERVQKQGCGCLCTLSSNSQNKGIIQNIGGVDSIVYAMWAHYNSEDIQIEACRALSSLAVDIHTNEVMIASEGEVNAIVSAMRRFPNSESLQEHACVALRNFLLSADNVEILRMSQGEVCEVVSQAAMLFPATCSERANQVLSSLQ